MMAAAPILTRLYDPDDFGLLAVYSGILALVLVVASVRYELAIPLPEDEEEAANIAVLSLLIVLGVTALSALGLALFGAKVVDVLGVPALAGYTWLLPFGVLLGGAYTVFNYWAIRTQQFPTIAKTQLRQALATIGIQMFAFKLGSGALIVGQVSGHCVGTLSLARLALQSPAFRAVTWSGVRRAAVRYRRLPIFSTWSALFNTAGAQLPALLFAALFSPVAAGLFMLVNRVLQLPMSVIGSAIGHVFFASAAQAHREGNIAPLVADLYARLCHIGMPPTLVLILVGPDLFAWVFGAEWRQAGEFAQWMAPWFFLGFVSSPLSTLFTIFEREGQGLIFQSVLLFARIAALTYGAAQDDLSLTVILFSTASALSYIGVIVWIAVMSNNSFWSIVLPTLTAFGVAIICVLPLLIVLAIDGFPPSTWLFALVASSVLIAMRYWGLLRAVY